MKFRTECTYCKEKYDALLTECPHCNEPNNAEDVNSLKNLSVYPWWKELLFLGVGYLGFQIIGLIISLICHFAFGPESLAYSAVVNFTSYSIVFVALVCIAIPNFKELFKTFKGYIPYVAGLVGFIAVIGFTVSYNITLQVLKINISDNANETAVTSIITSFPILSLLIFGVIGPMCEELTYRVGLFTLSRRLARWAAYLISLTVFAFIHFDWTCLFGGDISVIINELINLPLYLFAGFTFGFLYDKFGLAASFTAHSLNNLFSIGMSILQDKLSSLGA